MPEGFLFGIPTIPYPTAPPRITTPVFRGAQTLQGGIDAVGGGLADAANYLTEPTALNAPPPVALPAQLQPNPKVPFAPGTVNLGGGTLTLGPAQPAPPPPANDYINTGLDAMKAFGTPDQAAATFAGGRPDSAAQLAAASPEWGGSDLGGNTALTASQMAQDISAHDLINSRYAQAMRDIGLREDATDPLGRQIDAQANLRKLESLLPVNQGPAFMRDRSGVIRNVQHAPLSQGDLANFQQKLAIAQASHPPHGYSLDSPNKIIGSQLENAMADIDSASDEEILSAMQQTGIKAGSAMEGREALKRQLQNKALMQMQGLFSTGE